MQLEQRSQRSRCCTVWRPPPPHTYTRVGTHTHTLFWVFWKQSPPCGVFFKTYAKHFTSSQITFSSFNVMERLFLLKRNFFWSLFGLRLKQHVWHHVLVTWRNFGVWKNAVAPLMVIITLFLYFFFLVCNSDMWWRWGGVRRFYIVEKQ